ncbi:MAG: hypothetical protein IKS18_06880 [Lachnospiraceae bacterium]|nr:hypothetical protein [Lachnospiraceae bacterium]
MKRNVGYEISFTNNTITMNFKFAAAASVYGSEEYKTLLAIKNDFPQLKEVVKAGRDVKKPNKNKNLKYDKMRCYIMSTSKDLLDVFEKVKEVSKVQKNPYKYVVDWFEKQFPDYRRSSMFVVTTDETKKKNVYADNHNTTKNEDEQDLAA